jgi:hypothetical protein
MKRFLLIFCLCNFALKLQAQEVIHVRYVIDGKPCCEKHAAESFHTPSSHHKPLKTSEAY